LVSVAVVVAAMVFLGGDDDALGATTTRAVTTTQGGGATTGPTPTQATTSAAPVTTASLPTAVAAAFVTATASSEASASGDLTYFASNTLDGSMLTAWNHDGTETNLGVGETLTFEFDDPVFVASIEIVNGYAKSDDVFVGNGRVRDLTVLTDAGSFGFVLDDHAEWQVLEGDFGTTGSVVLRVDSIYPGDRWNDLAVTEIRFFEISG
jgi:hypothetical protein